MVLRIQICAVWENNLSDRTKVLLRQASRYAKKQ